MLTPEALADLPEEILALWREVEETILADMARRIAAYDFYIPAADYQHERLLASGRTNDEIRAALAKLTPKSESELRQMMIAAGSRCLQDDISVYTAAGLSPVRLQENKELQNILNAGYQATAATMKNLTRTTANTATKQFEDALDRAWLQVSSGAIDANTAIRRAIKDLSGDGIQAIRYPTGWIDTVETAVRRAVVTGLNQTAARLQEELADEVGCDLVEVSAHAGARPDHAAWQGKIYSRSGKSTKYPDFRSATGYGTGPGLCGWNCRHTFGPYIEGSTPVWTEEKLAELNAPKYEYQGEKFTEYEARQREKYFDRQIHRWEREKAAMKAAGQDTAEAQAKVKAWKSRKNGFLLNRVTIPKSLSIKNTVIGRSLGAKAKNYSVIDKQSGIVYNLLEGSRLQDSTVFAGMGVRTPLKPEVAEGLCLEYGGTPEIWQHAKATAELTDGEEIRKAEVHWFQAEGIGKVKFKVKRWIDED